MPSVPLDLAPARRLLTLLLVAVAAASVLAGCGSASTSSGSTRTPASGAEGSSLAPAAATTDLSAITVDELPAEGRETLQLIDDGGPFPYAKDGVTFQNREGILPKQKSGFYQEYTVDTPGSSDRGARRIVTGKDGSRFYTDDHYDSFREVVSGAGS